MEDDWLEQMFGPFDGPVEPGQHGKCVGMRWEPYHDVLIYEDGTEEWISIGD